MHATAQGFLDAICRDPADDTVRLIYADFLDDEGEAERAELIRCQCELPSLKCDWLGVPGGPCEVYNQSRGEYRVIMWCKSCRRRGALRERERQLLAIEPPNSFTSDRNRAEGWSGGTTAIHWGLMVFKSLQPTGLLYERRMTWDWSRGFPSHITLTEADFLQHAEAIFRAAPIEEVTLSDKNAKAATWIGWRRWEYELGPVAFPTDIRPELYDLMADNPVDHFVTYKRVEEAWDALSSACVCLGRIRAGLPALEQ